MARETPNKRLDGWKAIAAHFRRDRSTIARWARERGLPVHRVPGGKQGTVFAFSDELDAWAVRSAAGNEPQASPGAPAPTTASSTAWWRRVDRRWAWVAVVATLTVAVAGVFAWRTERRVVNLPSDPAIARDYIAARDHWARRTPADLNVAIRLYQDVVRRAPTFAPAYAGLAEAWLIAREYGAVSDTQGYLAAQSYARKAIALDPSLPAGHRALGFIDYWWRDDARAAIGSFRRAIALNPNDAQSHFWYANVLADVGQHQLAQKEYDAARLLNPGSQAIAVEYACAHWQAGRDGQALQALEELAIRYPQDATIQNCLSWVHIGRGDIARFARAYRAMALLRKEPSKLAIAAAIDRAVATHPATAHRVVIAAMQNEIARGERLSRETPAFYASAMGDREELLGLLRAARNNEEQWHSATITSRIAARWAQDREIMGLLTEVQAPPPAL